MGRSAATAGLVLGLVVGMSGLGSDVAARPSPRPVSTVRPVPVAATFVAQPVAVALPDRVVRPWTGGAPTQPVPSLDPELVAAYLMAEGVAPSSCGLTAELLAALGQVESGNAAGHRLAGHRVAPAIIGPALDGRGRARVRDTDGGALDQDARWDHAVGPLQLTPSRWRVAGVDLDGDGVRDPQNLYDAAGAAMVHLCGGGRDLRQPDQLAKAVLDYNPAPAYLRLVLAWKAAFEAHGMWPDPMVEILLARWQPTSPGPTPARQSPAAVEVAAQTGADDAQAAQAVATQPAQPAPQPAPEPAGKPAVEPAPEPAVEPAPEPAAEPAAEPAVQPGSGGGSAPAEPDEAATPPPVTCPEVPDGPTGPGDQGTTESTPVEPVAGATPVEPTADPTAVDPTTVAAQPTGGAAGDDASQPPDPCAPPADLPADSPTAPPTTTPAPGAAPTPPRSEASSGSGG